MAFAFKGKEVEMEIYKKNTPMGSVFSLYSKKQTCFWKVCPKAWEQLPKA